MATLFPAQEPGRAAVAAPRRRRRRAARFAYGVLLLFARPRAALRCSPASASWRRVLAALCAWREDPAGRHRRRPARPQARRRPSGSSRPCRRGTCPTPRRPPAAPCRRRSSPAPPSSAWRATRSSSPTDPHHVSPLRLSGGFVDSCPSFVVVVVWRCCSSRRLPRALPRPRTRAQAGRRASRAA